MAKILTIRIQNTLAEKMNEKLKIQGLHKSELVRSLLIKWLEEK